MNDEKQTLICPLRLIGMNPEESAAYQQHNAACIEERCGFWITGDGYLHGRCAIPALASQLYTLTDIVHSIEEGL